MRCLFVLHKKNALTRVRAFFIYSVLVIALFLRSAVD